MPRTDIKILYLCALRVCGDQHHVTGLLSRALRSRSSADALVARQAIELLPPHRRATLMNHFHALTRKAA